VRRLAAHRPTAKSYQRMLKAVAPGDVVTVTRIDRLARSTFDLFAIVKHVVGAGAVPVTGRAVGRHRDQHGG
jgi:hypothetical protein